jgi:putative ABC transport system permease protein
MAPALYVLRSDPVRALLSGSRTTGPAGANRWRTVLVTGQIAFAFPVFCTTAALLVSFLALQRAAARYEPDHVLESLITIRGLEHRYDSEGRIEQLFGDIERALQGVPGVSSSASTVPMLLFRIRPSVLQPAGSGSAVRWTVQLRGVSHGFFSTMRIPVLSGRTFLESEQLSRRHVAVVSRSFARTYFRDTHVLGDRAQVTETLSWLRPVGTDPLEIIGVVEDIPLPTGNEDPVGVVPTMYVPRSLASPSAADILVRTALPASAVIPDMRQAIGKVDSDLVVQIDVLQNSIGRLWTAWPRLVVFVAGLFTGVGLVLVLVGIFGVLSYSIGQLTGEIGIRLALGASPARIGRQVLGQGVRWAAIGTALGSVATFALFTIVRSRVWGVGNLDSSLLATAAGVVLLLGAATSWFPARRAMRVDPLTVLRAE